MAQCGAKDDHCCYIGGSVCPFLRDDGDAERRWVCTLRERHGSWQAVHADEGYLMIVRPELDRTAQADCGDWPGPGVTCGSCGVTG
jgi:hypothetical protein